MQGPPVVAEGESGTPRSSPEPVAGLTPTGRVILGMIAFGRCTGYEIKQLVDRSTRHFWAASYGQIYPELKRLQVQGLVGSRSEPSGGRARVVYELTSAGRGALHAWLTSPEEPLYEIRDEGMLKLFFSDLADAEDRMANIREMRARHERKLAALRALQPEHDGEMASGPELTLELGIGLTEWMIGWCQATERRLGGEAG